VPIETCSITLAAGASNRMPEDMRPKACCKVGTFTVIENAFRTYEQAGIRRHVLVIGHAADQVMEEVTRTRGDVLFAYQSAPRGTGDAVRCAVELLAGVGPPETVVISAGDKVIAPRVVSGLLAAFAETGADFCLTAGPSRAYPEAGRVIEKDGRVFAVIEVPDIRVRQLAAGLRQIPPRRRPQTVGALAALVAEYFDNPDKARKCLPALSPLLASAPDDPVDWAIVETAVGAIPDGFDLPCGHISADEAAAAPLANIFVYAARFGPLCDAVRELSSDNVQGERYFTDVPRILTEKGFTVGLYAIDEPEDVMAFNTLAELEVIRSVHAQRSLAMTRYPTVGQWEEALSRNRVAGPPLEAVRLLRRRIGAGRPAIIVRSPGRINLMGRHVDHQGGTCNLMAIDREIALVASLRDDDRVNLWHADSRTYPERTFTVAELVRDVVWDDWLRTLKTQFIRRAAGGAPPDWGEYVKGACLRLQHRFRDRKLRGIDACISGDIPAGAGLGASSALVVAAAEALVELNGLNVRLGEFLDLCGEGEWFAGAREGHTDHVAIKQGRERRVLSVAFFPFRVLGHHIFPESCSLMVCHSGHPAPDAREARRQLALRLACFHLARELIKERFPELAPRIEHLRDVNAENLAVSLPGIYRIVAALPRRMEPDDVLRAAERFPAVAACLEGVSPAGYIFPVRDMAIYALAECERAARTGELLDRGDLVRLGAMMKASHDGDRVVRWKPDRQPCDGGLGDRAMRDLIERAALPISLEVTGAALWQQVGAYRLSTPEIDLMADIVGEIPGVYGAQISGAGMGGCLMVLARHDAVEEVSETLTRRYYEPRRIEPRIYLCRPSRGSRVLRSLDGRAPGGLGWSI